ncbi:Transglutaminase-like superfamily protein [Chitinophaga jiangningensis]|uniref:Transglutaminase-like superfamily protein n=1 Tax=Chitinophaga jiangningensis TaxID=1419482 RepID=A0A1M7FY09_9BACT|nr:transglutaminase domain-containing protein [Chitinophaga jiangningensis]SHM08567.1 Transglutaminase-like superfamily protein [Chitinophaga jiangningensis]
MSIVIVLACLLTVSSANAQAPKPAKPAPAVVAIPDAVTNSPADMAKWLKTHTTSNQAFQQALYQWIATHIAYDIPGMYQQKNYRDTAAVLQQVLRSRVGVCADYASLYARVCQEAGITAYTVNGYCLENGTLAPTGAHDWVVVKNGAQWTVTDPTWGAGTVDGARFTPKLNWEWFQVSPQVAVKRHIPFDPMWQLLTNPVRHDEVGVSRQSGPAFNYNDTINKYLRLPRYERLAGSLARIERYGGAANPFVMAELDWLRQTVKVLAGNREIEERNRLVDQFNVANADYAGLVKGYNEYVSFKNSQFLPEKPDMTVRKMMDALVGMAEDLSRRLAAMHGTDAAMVDHLRELGAAVEEMRGRIRTEDQFVSRYLKTEKAKRRSLFYVDVVEKS